MDEQLEIFPGAVGDAADNRIIGNSFTKKDAYDGGAGMDIFVLTVTSAGTIFVDFADGYIQIDGIRVPMRNFEAFEFSLTGDVEIIGSDGSESISTSSGDDTIFAARGNDTVRSNSGDDSVHGTYGRDELILGSGNDTGIGAFGNDVIAGGAGADSLHGGFGNDSLRGGNQNDTLEGSYDDDTLQGESGNDVLDGDAGDDVLDGSGGSDTIHGGANADEIEGGGSADMLYGGTGDDAISGSSGADQMWGEDGNDTLRGGGDGDMLVGGLGDDWLDGDGGVDSLFGGLGNDTLSGGEENGEEFFGEDGDDVMQRTGTASPNGVVWNGGLGSDTIEWMTLDLSGSWELNLASGYITRNGVRYDRLVDIENVTVHHDAPITGDERANVLRAVGEFDNLIDGGSGGDTIDGGAGNDTLSGGEGPNDVNGGDGDDIVSAGADRDTLRGGAGNDTVLGSVFRAADFYYGDDGDDLLVKNAGTGAAASTWDGGAGSDTLQWNVIDIEVDANWTIDLLAGFIQYQGENRDRLIDVENVTIYNSAIVNGDFGDNTIVGVGNFNNTFTGKDGDDILFGAAGNDSLKGDKGDDTLDGGTGADTLNGGLGNDTYVIDSAGDVIIEPPDGGFDTLATVFDNVTLDDVFENLTLLGSALSGTGSSGPNVMIGNEYANTFNGLGAADHLQGGIGADTLIGSTGNDTLDGGIGPDSLVGGLGNDRYIVDSVADIFVEEAGEGYDTLATSIDGITISANFEVLELLDTAITGYGDALDNVLIGSAGDNRLVGGAGNDTIIGALGADTLDGGTGVDSLEGGEGDDRYIIASSSDVIVELAGGGFDTVVAPFDYTLSDHLERLDVTGTAIRGIGNDVANTIFGNELDNIISGFGGDDYLVGREGDDVINGGTGIDTMVGGTGNDRYVVATLGDNAIEHSAEGDDTVAAFMDFTLDNNIEVLELLGTGDRIGTGNGLKNRLIGNDADNALNGLSGADTLEGGGGDDTLDGGVGPDSMAGGEGDDIYLVDQAGDTITEFNSQGIDHLFSYISAYDLPINVENGTVENGGGQLVGNSMDNQLQGRSGDDKLYGEGGRDIIAGGGGDDTLVGGSGRDTITGNSGQDRITTGDGSDRIVYISNGDSRGTPEERDIIVDFDRPRDKIDLSALDADRTRSGNQAFDFIGRDKDPGAGEITFSTFGSTTIMSANIDNDDDIEIQIKFSNTSYLTGSDFIL